MSVDSVTELLSGFHAAAIWRANTEYDAETNMIPSHAVKRDLAQVQVEALKLASLGLAAPSGLFPDITPSVWAAIKQTLNAPKGGVQEQDNG